MRKTEIHLLKVVDDSGKEILRKLVIGNKEKAEIEKKQILNACCNKKG